MSTKSEQHIMYIDCRNSGISGDMLLSSLYDLVDTPQLFNTLISLIKEAFPDNKITKSEITHIEKNGLTPAKLSLDINDTHHHTHIDQMKFKIVEICKKINLSQAAVTYATTTFDIIAEAESAVHNTPKEKVHLHEIGSIDTVIDICGVAVFMDHLKAFTRENIQIFCSRIPVGGGSIKFSHGILPVPAPATQKIIEKYHIPIVGGPIDKELCTPTGSALIASMILNCNLKFSEFMPKMECENSATSTGSLICSDFPNMLKIYQGSVFEDLKLSLKDESVVVLETTVDDVTGELIGHMMELLLSNGALDVNFCPVQSKKNRPATLIRVISSLESYSLLIDLLIRNLGTLGVRYRYENRRCIDRQIIVRNTKIDGIDIQYHVKIAIDAPNNNLINFKIEYEDLAKVSELLKRPIIEIKPLLESDFLNSYKKEKK
jgi:uncharacterized protein (TIGR00299 family) protein